MTDDFDVEMMRRNWSWRSRTRKSGRRRTRRRRTRRGTRRRNEEAAGTKPFLTIFKIRELQNIKASKFFLVKIMKWREF